MPSLDLVIYKMGGAENQYDPALTRLPVKYSYDGSRSNWEAGDPKTNRRRHHPDITDGSGVAG